MIPKRNGGVGDAPALPCQASRGACPLFNVVSSQTRLDLSKQQQTNSALVDWTQNVVSVSRRADDRPAPMFKIR